MASRVDHRPTAGLGKALIGATEGLVNLAFVFAGYRLLAVPVLSLARALLPPATSQLVAVGVTVVLVLLALAIVVGIGRLSGLVVAAGVGVVAVAAFATFPSVDLGLPPGVELVWSVQAVVVLAGLVVLMAARAPLLRLGERFAGSFLFPLIVTARPTATATELTEARRRLTAVLGTAIDLVLLLVADALLRPPLVAAIGVVAGSLPAAILISGVLGLVWLVLALRLRALGGWPGLMLAVLLGAPLLLTLPLLDPRLLGAAWPGTVAAWLVAIIASLLLVAARRPLQVMGQSAFGPALDRGLMGANAASGEDAGVRRVAACGGIVGALLDVGLLLGGYWLLGLPLVGAIERSTGQSWIGSGALVGLLVATAAIIWGRMRTAQRTFAETGGDGWARRAAVVPALALGLAFLLVSCFAAVPTVLAAPPAERFGAAPPADHVVVNWQFWQPSTPSATDATYNVAFSCSNGDSLGEFREAFRPGAGGSMPSGPIAPSDPTLDPQGVACSSWHDLYFGLRRAAGLTTASALSWNWVDLRIALGADGAANVSERHWVSFTSGVHDQIAWTVAGDLQGGAEGIEVQDGDAVVPLNPTGPTPASYAEIHPSGGNSTITWHFPPVTAPAQHTLVVRYRLPHAAQSDGARTRFSRLVLGPRAGPVWRATVAVLFPDGTTLADSQLASSDPRARHRVIDQRTAWFEAIDAPSDGSLTVSVDNGASAPPPPPPTATMTAIPSPTATLAAIGAVVDAPTETPIDTATPVPTEGPGDSPTPAVVPTDTPTPGQTTTVVIKTPTRPPASATFTATQVSTASVTAFATASTTASATATPLTTCTGDEHMTFSPANPVVGQQLTITVTASRDLLHVSLSGPDSPQGPTRRTDFGNVEWDWQVTPSAAGNRDYYFFAVNNTLCTTNRVVVLPALTATPTLVPTSTPTLVPTKTSTLVPTNTVTLVPTITRTPTATPCATFGIQAFTATPNYQQGQVTLAWQSSGGCSPISGTIVAQYNSPYITPTPTKNIGVTGGSGTTVDTPPQGCWTTINYSLTLRDSAGHNATASTQTNLCG